MSPLLLVVALAIFAVGFLAGRMNSAPATAPDDSDVKIAEVSLKEFEGQLKELRGSPVIVNFWASWCGPCRKEAPALEQAYRKYKSQGLKVIGVNSGDTPAGAKGFIKEFDVTYPVVRDGTDEISVAYRVNGLPTTVFYDSKGDIVDTAVGALDEKKFDQYLATFIKR